MMDLAEIRPGQQVLDVAIGIGEPAVTAARLVGQSVHVIAIAEAAQKFTTTDGSFRTENELIVVAGRREM